LVRSVVVRGPGVRRMGSRSMAVAQGWVSIVFAAGVRAWQRCAAAI
jgi:fructose-1,6-bisphosphatase/inositol monophosphatase family enzyme